MGKARDQSMLLRNCGEAYGVTVRTVRNWRDASDRRWVEFLAERARSSTCSSTTPAGVTDEPQELGTGLEFELIRLRNECLDLARRARASRAAGDLSAEMAINRMLDTKRETLRRMEMATPEITVASGEAIPRAEVQSFLTEYTNGVVALLASLPDRIVALIPNIDPAVLAAIQNDIDDIRRAARDIKSSPEPYDHHIQN